MGYISPGLDSKIQKGDILGINVSSLSKVEDAIFSQGPSSDLQASGYPVGADGYIFFHRLGKLKAEGLTRTELATLIKNSLQPYLTDALVSVYYQNRKITIAGDVNAPRVLPMPEEQMSIMDALVSSGDLKPTALRSDIVIIRDSLDKKLIKHVNLEDHSILNSPWFYLQANDIVIVKNDFQKTDRDEKRMRFQTNFAIITSSVSLLIVILSRFIK